MFKFTVNLFQYHTNFLEIILDVTNMRKKGIRDIFSWRFYRAERKEKSKRFSTFPEKGETNLNIVSIRDLFFN